MELKTWVDRHVIGLLGAICVVSLSCKSCEKGICAVQLLAVSFRNMTTIIFYLF